MGRNFSPPALKDFKDAVAQLKLAIMDEVPPVFLAIIQDYAAEGLYRIALYHCGEYSRYLLVSFSTQKGLEQVTEQYMSDSNLSSAEEKISLKWSACDSPYHDDEGYSLPKVERILREVRQQSGLIFDQMEAHYGYSEKLYDILMAAYEEVHEAIVVCLQDIAKLPAIAAWITESKGTLMLDAGDIGAEILLVDIERINGKQHRDAVKAELDLAEEYFSRSLAREHTTES